MKITNGLVVVAGMLFAQGAAWATVSACSTAAGGAAISTYGAQATTNGCAYIDKSFTDFGIAGTLGSTALNTNLTLAGSTLSGSSGTAFADFINPNWTVNSGGTGTATVNYVVQSHQSGEVFNGYTFTNGSNGFVDPPAGDAWTINSIVADLSAGRVTSIGGNGPQDAAVLKEAFCLGDASLSTTGACAAAAGSAYGFIQITNTAGGYTYSCQGLGGVAVAGCNSGGFSVTGIGVVSFALATHQSAISIFDTLTLNSHSGTGHVTTVSDFSNNFGESADSPEPSTFVLFGSALGFICMRYRRRRNKS
jgi:hypothetical protein